MLPKFEEFVDSLVHPNDKQLARTFFEPLAAALDQIDDDLTIAAERSDEASRNLDSSQTVLRIAMGTQS